MQTLFTSFILIINPCMQKNKEFKSQCLYAIDCPHNEAFKSFEGLKKHIRRFHINFFDSFQTHQVNNSSKEHSPVSGRSTNADLIKETAQQDLVEYNSKSCQATQENLEEEAGGFLLKMLSDNKHTASGVSAMILEVQKLIESAVHSYALRLKYLLPENENLIQALANFPSPFKSLSSSASQMSFFSKHFGLVEPRILELPTNSRKDFGRHRIKKDQSFKKQKYVVVPILEQLRQLLNVKDIFEEIFLKEVQASKSGIYSRFEDSKKFKESLFFQNRPRGLRIILYLDEVQICNPIGSKTHKLVFVYFTLQNLPSQFRSKLKSVFLISIFYAQNITVLDPNVVLRPIYEDLAKLEEGVEFELFSGKQLVFGTLIAIVADNLASHQFGGFKASFSRGFRKCRTCLSLDADIQSKYCDSECIYRTKEDHDAHCSRILSGALNQHFSRIYGINYDSIFNKLKHYQVISGLPPDIMHDLLEGVVPFVLCKVLNFVVKRENSFTLAEFNHLIKNYNYGPEEIRDNPSEIKKSHLKNVNLRQSSTQTRLLMRLLPLMVVKKVPVIEKSLWWKALKNLSEICRIVFSDVVYSLDILRLRLNVGTFLSRMKKLNVTITPKMHHLIHYPYYIMKLGPLKQFWCMRFEGKHSFFKSTARTTGNFINAPLTLAKRHQQWLTNKIREADGSYIIEEISFSKCMRVINSSSLVHWGQLADITGQINVKVKILDWIEIHSSRIRSNESIVLLSMNGAIKCKFGLVRAIYQLQAVHEPVLLCQMMRTKKFNERYQAFEVYMESHHVAIKLNCLKTMQTYTLRKPSYAESALSLCSQFFVAVKDNIKDQLLNPLLVDD